MDKSTTGIPGFDDIVFGGLPSGRTTLVTGGPGCGKTVFALQTLVHGAREQEEPGIFVAFEEDPTTLKVCARTFDWKIDDLPDNLLHFMDARPTPDVTTAGSFDIGGLLALLDIKVRDMGATRIVFDAIDMLLVQMGRPEVVRREVYRLQDWLTKTGLTAIITSKTSISDPQYSGLPSMEFMQYMVACSVILNNDIVDGVSQRSLRIAKYRGSSFHGNSVPFLIGQSGLDIAFIHARRVTDHVFAFDRVPSGLPALDRMLRGGFFRGACVLVTGLPGTGKTTLCGAFVAAACARGEKSLLISFVSRTDEIVQNLQSVGIDLQPHLDSGLLRMVSTRASNGSAETHLLSIRSIALEHGATCIVTDPLSALAKSGNRSTAPGVSERLVDWTKSEGRTLLCTSLLDDADEPTEATPLQISTIADSWLHLTNEMCGLIRKRTLSIIKSRGTDHSNQIREFLLSHSGLALVDVYTSSGEVLAGALQWSHDRADHSGTDDPVSVAAAAEDVAELQNEMVQLQGALASKLQDSGDGQ